MKKNIIIVVDNEYELKDVINIIHISDPSIKAEPPKIGFPMTVHYPSHFDTGKIGWCLNCRMCGSTRDMCKEYNRIEYQTLKREEKLKRIRDGREVFI